MSSIEIRKIHLNRNFSHFKNFWAQKLTLWFSFWSQKLLLWFSFWFKYLFPQFLPIEKEKNNLNRFWIIDEFNRHKKNPFKHKYFPFYEFLGPETEIMVQFLDPEIVIMVEIMLRMITQIPTEVPACCAGVT